MSPQETSNLLELYRRKSSFNSEFLRELVNTREVVEIEKELSSRIEKDPLFKFGRNWESLNDTRRNAQLRARRIIDYGFLHDPRMKYQPLYLSTVMTVLNQYDSATMIKATISHNFYAATIRGLGSSEQQHFADDIASEKAAGCFGLTEIAHGTDARHMLTRAVYDPHSQQFLLQSDDFRAAKCWVGNLAQGATHAVVFSQLIMPDGKNEGLHAFVVPIRDPETLLPYEGVIIGDLGEKIGVNGIDNGFCMFKNYRIPRGNLLSKMGVVTEDGRYVSPLADPSKRFALALGTLVGARLGVFYACLGFLASSLTIALRYSAVRKQFGPSDYQEIPVIEYPLQQWRLLPHLGALFAMKAASKQLTTIHFDFQKSLYKTERLLDQDESDMLVEFHGLVSVLKALYSWTTQAAIQECRESCGGHGYLKCSGLGKLRNDNDPACTYDGANNVLQQQASNWVMKLWRARHDKQFPSPLGSVHFLYKSCPDKMTVTSEALLSHPPVILEAYQWLICHLAERMSQAQQRLLKSGNAFSAQNSSQVYLALNLSMAYGEHYLIKCLWEQSVEVGKHCVRSREVLTKLCALYGLYNLERYSVYLHQGNYVDTNQSELIQSAVMTLCDQLKNEAVSLADVVAPSDFILNSVIGHSNGELYQNLEKELMSSVDKATRPEWWPELSGRLRSHL